MGIFGGKTDNGAKVRNGGNYEQMVRTYWKSKDFEKDAARLGKDGWQVANTTSKASGGSTWFGNGSSNELVVTYSRGEAVRQAPPLDSIEELRRLAALRDRGVIDNDQFEYGKKQLLKGFNFGYTIPKLEQIADARDEGLLNEKEFQKQKKKIMNS